MKAQNYFVGYKLNLYDAYCTWNMAYLLPRFCEDWFEPTYYCMLIHFLIHSSHCHYDIMKSVLWLFLKVDEWYDKYQMNNGLQRHELQRRIFIATDEPSIISDAKKR